MYTILCDGSLLHDTTSDDSRVFDAVLDLELNTANFLNFTIYPSHPLYGLIRKFKSVIEVYQDGVLLFRGRVLSDTVTFDKAKNVVCEGDRAFLNDSILRPYNFNGSIEDYLTMMIDSHNAQVEVDKQFTLGNVTVTDPNDYIVRSNSNYVKTWEEINNKLIGNLGGYILVRRVSGVNYIDYLADSPYMSTQTIELGENLLDVIKETRADDIVTALIPLGANLKDEEGNETDERLTIESVNGGLDYIHDVDAVAQYGYIFDTVTYDNVTVASNLLTKAQQDLAIRINLGVNVELKAIDLSLMENVDEIRLFEYVQVTSQPHDIDTMALITKLSIDLLNPQNNTFTFGFSYQTFTDKQIQSDKAIKEIQSDYVTNEKVSEVRNSITNLSSNIEQTAEQIRTEVAETYVSTGSLDEYKSEVSTQFTQTSDQFNFNFNTLQTEVNDLESETQTKFTEIDKYIRFKDGNIELGDSNSQIKLVLENDIIKFEQNGVPVAYIDNNTLYITDGQFLNSLRIGNFAFTPRANGNLSFGKVV